MAIMKIKLLSKLLLLCICIVGLKNVKAIPISGKVVIESENHEQYNMLENSPNSLETEVMVCQQCSNKTNSMIATPTTYIVVLESKIGSTSNNNLAAAYRMAYDNDHQNQYMFETIYSRNGLDKLSTDSFKQTMDFDTALDVLNQNLILKLLQLIDRYSYMLTDTRVQTWIKTLRETGFLTMVIKMFDEPSNFEFISQYLYQLYISYSHYSTFKTVVYLFNLDVYFEGINSDNFLQQIFTMFTDKTTEILSKYDFSKITTFEQFESKLSTIILYQMQSSPYYSQLSFTGNGNPWELFYQFTNIPESSYSKFTKTETKPISYDISMPFQYNMHGNSYQPDNIHNKETTFETISSSKIVGSHSHSPSYNENIIEGITFKNNGNLKPTKKKCKCKKNKTMTIKPSFNHILTDATSAHASTDGEINSSSHVSHNVGHDYNIESTYHQTDYDYSTAHPTEISGYSTITDYPATYPTTSDYLTDAIEGNEIIKHPEFVHVDSITNDHTTNAVINDITTEIHQIESDLSHLKTIQSGTQNEDSSVNKEIGRLETELTQLESEIKDSTITNRIILNHNTNTLNNSILKHTTVPEIHTSTETQIDSLVVPTDKATISNIPEHISTGEHTSNIVLENFATTELPNNLVSSNIEHTNGNTIYPLESHKVSLDDTAPSTHAFISENMAHSSTEMRDHSKIDHNIESYHEPMNLNAAHLHSNEQEIIHVPEENTHTHNTEMSDTFHQSEILLPSNEHIISSANNEQTQEFIAHEQFPNQLASENLHMLTDSEYIKSPETQTNSILHANEAHIDTNLHQVESLHNSQDILHTEYEMPTNHVTETVEHIPTNLVENIHTITESENLLQHQPTTIEHSETTVKPSEDMTSHLANFDINPVSVPSSIQSNEKQIEIEEITHGHNTNFNHSNEAITNANSLETHETSSSEHNIQETDIHKTVPSEIQSEMVNIDNNLPEAHVLHSSIENVEINHLSNENQQTAAISQSSTEDHIGESSLASTHEYHTQQIPLHTVLTSNTDHHEFSAKPIITSESQHIITTETKDEPLAVIGTSATMSNITNEIEGTETHSYTLYMKSNEMNGDILSKTADGELMALLVPDGNADKGKQLPSIAVQLDVQNGEILSDNTTVAAISTNVNRITNTNISTILDIASNSTTLNPASSGISYQQTGSYNIGRYMTGEQNTNAAGFMQWPQVEMRVMSHIPTGAYNGMGVLVAIPHFYMAHPGISYSHGLQPAFMQTNGQIFGNNQNLTNYHTSTEQIHTYNTPSSYNLGHNIVQMPMHSSQTTGSNIANKGGQLTQESTGSQYIVTHSQSQPIHYTETKHVQTLPSSKESRVQFHKFELPTAYHQTQTITNSGPSYTETVVKSPVSYKTITKHYNYTTKVGSNPE